MDETIVELQPAELSLSDLDTEAIRARHPEAFRWCCCLKSGTQQGCTPGHHESNPDYSRKGSGQYLFQPDSDLLDASGTMSVTSQRASS